MRTPVTANRWSTLSHGLAFVLGFSVVFVLLGATASAVGALLYDVRGPLTRIGGLVVIVFGLHTLGVIHIPFLEYDTRRQQAPDPRLGYLSSALMGVFFSAGWAPCVGPVLGAVLTMALNADGVTRGIYLLSAYSLGLGIPFLLAAAGVGNVSYLLRRYSRYLRNVSAVTGVFLIIVGVMLFTNTLTYFATVASFNQFQNTLDQGVVSFWQRLSARNVDMDPTSISFGLAFLAGLASFLSPCVLSLVPAYIGYLSSRAVITSG